MGKAKSANVNGLLIAVLCSGSHKPNPLLMSLPKTVRDRFLYRNSTNRGFHKKKV
jgi:hypothetical protein